MTELPKQIGPYHIRRLIATGGMGIVYEGLQPSPRRAVAIKVVSAELAGEEAAARLRYEAQLLARLRHPGIAEIYEAGTYVQDGKQLPFFAMEYIPNPRSITAYANERNLTTRQRLELFAEVCDAIHHGHQRGIVHRDLKPANIIVDSEGRVKIIDFGIARATDADLRRTSVQTEVGQLVGSAAYMSPEQFEADPRDIDTRSDVYALGVVLYELLSGDMPYDAKSRNIYEVAMLIKEERPPLLSTRRPEFKGELEIIVDKALQKDRHLRYESAHGFAADIRRYLSGEAIAARPPSLKYQIQVFARRNRAVVGLLAAVLTLLVAGISVTSWLYVSVSRERARAEYESESAAKARDFLTSAIGSFTSPGYDPLPGVGQICDRAAQELDGTFTDAPETEADVRLSLAEAYWKLKRIDDAEQHFKRALALRTDAYGRDDRRTLSIMERMHRFYAVQGLATKRLNIAREIAESYERSLGPEAPETFYARYELVSAHDMAYGPGEAAEPAAELAAFCATRFGKEHPFTVEAELLQSWLLMQSGRLEQSLALAREDYQKANQLYPDGGEVSEQAKRVLAASLLATGNIDEPKAMYGHMRLPDRMDVEQEFQGSYTPHDSDVTILVFWESWCPWSQRAVPKLDRVYRQYRDFGVDVVGITNCTRSATPESVREFIAQEQIAMPVVKETGRMQSYFECPGTPYVCVTHNDELVWKGTVMSAEEFSHRIIEGMLKPTQ